MDDQAFLDESDSITGDFYFTEKVGVQENGGTSLTQFPDDVSNQPASNGVQTGSGFIKQDQSGII